MRPQCARCGLVIAPDGEACICSYETTFCIPCATVLQRVCPCCEGELIRRPTRTSAQKREIRQPEDMT